MTDPRYKEGIEALRELVDGFETEDHEVAAKAAAGFLDQVDNPNSILFGLDPEAVARTCLSLTAIVLLIRDGTTDTLDHLIEVDEEDEPVCEDPSCTTSHDEVDFEGFKHFVGGLDTAIDALAGISLALADREVGFDPDTVDWTI